MADFTWTFASDADGWTGSDSGHGGAAATWTGASGNPAGSLQMTVPAIVGSWARFTTTEPANEIINLATTISWDVNIVTSADILDLIIVTDVRPSGVAVDTYAALTGWLSRGPISLAAYEGEKITSVQVEFRYNPPGGGGTGRVDNVQLLNTGFNQARFYQGAGVLVEKFTMPFNTVAPGAMTLDKALGTVVIGSREPAGVVAIYANDPYPTGTATDTGLPTGTAIMSVKWI